MKKSEKKPLHGATGETGSKRSTGRNPSENPKQHFNMYVARDTINEFGDVETARAWCYAELEKEATRRKAEKQAAAAAPRIIIPG